MEEYILKTIRKETVPTARGNVAFATRAMRTIIFGAGHAITDCPNTLTPLLAGVELFDVVVIGAGTHGLAAEKIETDQKSS